MNTQSKQATQPECNQEDNMAENVSERSSESNAPDVKEKLDDASFQATYSALTRLFKIKQKKYAKALELALLEGQISLKAIVVIAALLLLCFLIVGTLWCLINVAIVLGFMQFFSSLWLGLLVSAGLNVLLLGLVALLIRKVKRELGFKRSKQLLEGRKC